MCRLIVGNIFVNCLEQTIKSLFVFFHVLVVDADVTVSIRKIGRKLSSLKVPSNCLLRILLFSSVNHSKIVESPSKERIFFCNPF